jgi:S-layer protein (TIGR01567 family)
MSFRKQLIMGTFAAITAVLLIWGASLITVDNQSNMDDSRVNNSMQPEKIDNSTQPEKIDNITILEKPFRMPVSVPGSRYVWADDAGVGSTFNLTPMNFDGFYYDLDNNAGSESFSIKLGNPDKRFIKEDDLKYSSTISNIPFKYRPFGNYGVIGFMGERYFAGFTDDSKFSRSSVNLLNHRLLLGILMDENASHTLTTGRGVALSDGYAIWVESVNIDEGTAQISLKKNGEDIDSRSVKAGETYVYKKDIRKVKSVNGDLYDDNITVGNLPIIAIKIDSVLFKENVPAITINGIFQLSDEYTKIESVMKITDISDKGISMANENSIELQYPYIDFELHSSGRMGNIGIKVADSEILRFHLEKDPSLYENHERRGAVYTESNPVLAWDGLNFAGFLYDLDSGNYSENLEIINLWGRTIPANSLRYTAFITEIPFAVTKKTGIKPSGTNGSYKAVGFGADKYAAIKGKSSLLAQILIDNGTNYLGKKTLLDGEILKLKDGYTLTVKSVNAGSTSRRPSANAQLALGRNGIEFDEKWISQGSVYTYTGKKSSEENDLPVFITYLHSVFAGGPNLIQLKYTWLVSDNVTEINEGDRFGVFKVTSVEPDFIELKNDRAINLSAGSRINLIGNLGFAIANSTDLRFYPSNNISQNLSHDMKTVDTIKN